MVVNESIRYTMIVNCFNGAKKFTVTEHVQYSMKQHDAIHFNALLD